MYEFLKPKEAIVKELNTNKDIGLTSKQVLESAAKHGENTLTRSKPESLFKRIWHSATEPMILMLIAAGVIALVVNIIRAATGSEADFWECVGIFVAISLSVIITVVMEGKSAKAFEELNKINEDVSVKVLRNGNPIMLNQKDIVVGDILILATGDKIPADGRLLESTELSVDESTLTGESLPAKKDSEYIISDEKTSVAERFNMLYSGTYITSGFCKMVVTSVGDHTEFGKIAKELSATDKTSTPLQERLSRLGKTITIFGIIAATIVFISQLISFALHDGLRFEEVMEAFVTSIVLIVAAVPEGLPTIVAVSLSINIIKLSKQNALVKKMIASETVGCINVICSDKTGTLTENKMTVIGNISDTMILNNICINSTADIGENAMFIGNPTECALLMAAGKANIDYRMCRQNTEITHVFPFSSEEKDMTTIVKEDETYIAYTKGSPEKIFRSCNISEKKRTEIEKHITEYQKKACRIIAFAHRIYYECPEFDEEAIESEMEFDGFVAISDPLRADVYDAVNTCRLAGVSLKILTGDNIVTATAIANELHILDDNQIAIEAKEIEDLSDKELTELLPRISVIARSTPTIKMRVVNLLKAMGNVVAVTGDGINDAPALKKADVGIAMGISGTEVSKEASDIVLLNDSFSTIVNAVRWGRGIYENFKRFISFQLTVNVSSVIVVFVSILLGLKAPFTALQLLWINIIMDGPPALTLGLEPIHDDLMNQKPVNRSDNILSKTMLTRIGITGLYISVVFLLQYVFNFLDATDAQMPTVLFTLFALFQLFNSFNCRELHTESIFKNILKNKLMLLVISITFILQILIIQFAGAFFGTIPLPLAMWMKLFWISVSVIILSELIKLLKRY
ncbi:calcium-translocating P-type ATPase, PMCA-type [Anaerosporobacter sp.]|uniref:calcium-translocating P-type ATPase, PMCA-type n=1 Tax=Anaerosporobacter sp. TaxID=1872529 RepID=UPI00286EDC2B|nr:calcium-translocating P-type ATPase, PMCA-type [Anaerosporobacter sp.]